MKNHNHLLLTAAAAFVAGAVLAPLSNARFTAALPLDIIFTALAGATVLGFAFYDYSRRPKPLHHRATILRPAAPVTREQPVTKQVDRLAA